MNVVHNDGDWWVWNGVFPTHDGLQNVRLEPGVPVKARLNAAWAAMQGPQLRKVADPTVPAAELEEDKPRKGRPPKAE